VILSGCNQWDLVLGTDCDNAPISELEVRVLRLVFSWGSILNSWPRLNSCFDMATAVAGLTSGI